MSKITGGGKLRITEPSIISIWGHKFTKEEFDKLVIGLKTPTLDEVVNTALKNNFDCWYEEDLNRIVFGAVLPEFFVYKDKVVSAMPQTNHYFKDYEMFDMGRRYLESQKEKKNEKTVNAKNRKQRIFNRTATPRK